MSTTDVGDAFERRTLSILEAELARGALPIRRECAQIYHKKGYYSKDRGKQIVFDIAIEVRRPSAIDYSFLLLIECKDLSRAVPVEDVEQFVSKCDQVAYSNCKALMFSDSEFQEGALSFAKSKGVGLARIIDEQRLQWILERQALVGSVSRCLPESVVVDALTRADFRGGSTPVYGATPSTFAASLCDIVGGVIAHGDMPRDVEHWTHVPPSAGQCVPFVRKGSLESKTIYLLSKIGYRGGPAPLDAICKHYVSKFGLVVNRGIMPSPHERHLLGRIRFSPLCIDIFRQPECHEPRDRFTLAHELAHYLLGHGKYMVQESSGSGDEFLASLKGPMLTDIDRLEWQANYFASCLLMPRDRVVVRFTAVWNRLGLRTVDGRPIMLVDRQQSNMANFEAMMDDMASSFCVSRQAAAIRLQDLNLLVDRR